MQCKNAAGGSVGYSFQEPKCETLLGSRLRASRARHGSCAERKGKGRRPLAEFDPNAAAQHDTSQEAESLSTLSSNELREKVFTGGAAEPSYKRQKLRSKDTPQSDLVLPSAHWIQPGSGTTRSTCEVQSQDESVRLPGVRKHAIERRLGALFQREIDIPSRRNTQENSVLFKTWIPRITTFRSGQEDFHECLSVNDSAKRALPFCTASCNANSLVAIGDEDGGVRLLDTAKHAALSFREPLLSMLPHENAILDMEFSSDDLLLATASGDQTCQVIDMFTQRTTHVLAGHASSVKQIIFSPRSGNNVLATSSRDGSIRLWDLRCKGIGQKVLTIQQTSKRRAAEGSIRCQTQNAICAATVNKIPDAHLDTANNQSSLGGVLQSKQGSVGRRPRAGISTTTITFASERYPQYLLSGSEADSSVRLWDIRFNYTQRAKREGPLSTANQIESHSSQRGYGLTSMAVSGDGARLYTLCKDNGIHVYSTPHLILGSMLGEETDLSRVSRSLRGRPGMGPMYSFRHPSLRTSSFYVRLALRRANNSDVEMLATGSANACALLFPTDERYFRHEECAQDFLLPKSEVGLERNCKRSDTRGGTGQSPIFRHGVALNGGHEKEVTSLTWSSTGDLVTISDDLCSRVWRQNMDFDAHNESVHNCHSMSETASE